MFLVVATHESAYDMVPRYARVPCALAGRGIMRRGKEKGGWAAIVCFIIPHLAYLYPHAHIY